jgi:predicted RNA binding protein YcfA (HicA-like mRNA interferase family)
MTHPGPPRRMVSFPVHGNRMIAPGTLSPILEQAQLSVDQFTTFL